MWNINEFAAISIRMASPERIREWSHGEVKKPETINYRTLKPELEGLFCERIFGSTKDWECYCGKFKSIRYKGVVCDRCQVEVTHSKVRRERMGHIDLAAPVSHIWYFKGIPSKLGILLGMTMKELDRVLYFQDYVVLEPGSASDEDGFCSETGLRKKQLLSELEYGEAVRRHGTKFKVGMGAEAVRSLLVELDLPAMRLDLREKLAIKQSKADEKQMIRQLGLVEAFIASNNRPEWLILTVLPVIPPELRPMVQLDGGRFATSDLNDLYRRVINRNNRLRRLIDLKAPTIIIRNEMRMLQESVDALLDNGRRGRAVKSASNNRVLKSLSDMLKGKQGRFRQNLLGKRVDYSGRSVIVIGPALKLNECGLPKRMALELFKPFIMKELVARNLASNIKAAKKMVEREASEVWEVIEDVIADHPVLLNRAPTLHRLGIQAFQPVLVEGKAIRLHPLVCVAFNADFDGDQMAVHVPLSTEALVECRVLMMADRNILSPASGKPVITPTQDIVLGIYYLTKERESLADIERLFSNFDECLFAVETGEITLHSRVRVRLAGRGSLRGKTRLTETTPGRVIFNSILPEELEYINATQGKAQLSNLFDEIFRRFGETVMARVADQVKKLGFKYATRSGISIGIDDMRIPNQKGQLLDLANDDVAKINSQHEKEVITDQERYTKIIDLWTNTTAEVAKVMFDEIESDKEGFNPIYIMADSGARGSKAQIKQLAGMRGLMADPFGKIRETPITSNFREGLSVLEFFQSTTGARKGLTDTALKTANAGYLTRRLVDVSQDVVVSEQDCGTKEGVLIGHRKTGGEISQGIHERALGRYIAEDVLDPREDEKKILLKAGTYVDEEVASTIENCGVEELKIRTTLTCASKRGVCIMCYGRDLANGRIVEIGEAVGVIAAQSIGEPGTQLTLRTFHVGGTASADDTYMRARFSGQITSLPSVKEQEDATILVTRPGEFKGHRMERIEVVPKVAVIHTNSRGTRIQQPLKSPMKVKLAVKDGDTIVPDQEVLAIEVSISDDCKIKSIKKDSIIISVGGKKTRRIDIPGGLKVVAAEGDKISAGTPLALRTFLSSFHGTVEKSDRRGGGDLLTLTSNVEENISAVSEKGVLIDSQAQVGAEPKVKPGDKVEVGDIIGVNPGYNPIIAPMSGRIDFERAQLQREGNEQIVTKPDGIEGDEQASLIVWKGQEYVISPSDNLRIKAGESVEVGANISDEIVSTVRGTLHVVRVHKAKDGNATGYVVRVVESGEKRTLPYLKYTRTSAGSAKSKSLSKVKKQNIRLISKSHVVLHQLYRKYESSKSDLNAMIQESRGSSVNPGVKSDVFAPSEYVYPTQKAVKDICDYEEKDMKSRSNIRCEEGMLIVKIFSDFLRGAKEGAGEKSGMTMDITGGLPRVEELVELRKPKATPASVCPVSGTVSLGVKFRKSRIVEINSEDGETHEIEIPAERHLIVDDGQEVLSGDLLSDGPVDLHELLTVKNETDVQLYIVDEVQDVYRSQGVEINDKHIEVIVRQMMRKVQIESAGDTEFLAGDLVDRIKLADENERVENLKKRPATFKPVLLGITKAAKHSDSFISAASFQETTWALTNAAIQGKRDELRGLKENVIIGHLIPAGTGMRTYRDGVEIKAQSEEEDTDEVAAAPASNEVGASA